MKTTWYSMCAAALVGLMLTGCNKSPEKAKVDADKDAKVNQADTKADLKRDNVKREADAKTDAINAQEKAEKDAAKREADMKKDVIDANKATNP